MSQSSPDKAERSRWSLQVSRRTVLRGALLVPGFGAMFRTFPAAAANPVPAARMREVYEQLKTPYKHGVVIPQGVDGHHDSPSVFRHAGAWYMVYIVFRNNGYETRLARSANLLNWTLLGTILPFRAGAWDASQAAGYIALQDTTFGGTNELRPFNGQYWLTYIGGSTSGYEEGLLSIGVASTPTPDQATPWQRRDRAVLAPNDPDARWFESSKLYKSNVIEDPNRTLGARFVMYYNATGNSAAGNTGTEYMTMAVSDDMVTWRRYGANPILSAPGTYINRVVGDPQVVRVGDVWVMSYWSRESSKPGTGVFNSFAASYDLVNWTPWDGEKLMTTTVPYERSAAHKPWFIKHDGVVYQFYSAVGDQGFGIAVATSRDLRAPAGATVAGASYTYLGDSPGEAIDGVVSYNNQPENRWTAWDSPNRSDWLMVEYPSARAISSVTLDIYNDNGGVRPPRSYDVQYWNGSTWVSAPNQQHSPAVPAVGTNTATFSLVTTSRVRVFFAHADPANGIFSGVTELRVNGGNLVNNPGFEANGATQNPSGWVTWPGDAGVDADADYTETGGRNGGLRLTHYKAQPYQVYTSQTITGLTPGLYTARAWVLSGGGQAACFFSVKWYGAGVPELTANIPYTGFPNWRQVEIRDIQVTGTEATIGFYSKAGAGQWASIDDVEFVRQS